MNGLIILEEFFENKREIGELSLFLNSDIDRVKEIGAFCASELGSKTFPVIRSLLPLLSDASPHIRWDVYEAVFMCSMDIDPDFFHYIIEGLSDSNEAVSNLCIRLSSKGGVEQFLAAKNHFNDKVNKSKNDLVHLFYIKKILKENPHKENFTKHHNDLSTCYEKLMNKRFIRQTN